MNKEKYVFKLYEDLTNIHDSMQLDSNTVIAELVDDKDVIRVSLEVKGEVKVFWNPDGDPFDGNYYNYPSEFPEGLKKLIAEDDQWFENEHLYISENNWFEVFFFDEFGSDLGISEVVDVEQEDPQALEETLWECYQLTIEADAA